MNALAIRNLATMQGEAFEVAAEHLAWCEEQGISRADLCRALGFPTPFATYEQAFAAIVATWIADKLTAPVAA